MLLLECGNIKKYFQDRLVVDIDNLSVYAEDRIGIVGVNGAGKTTLVNILSKKLEPDEGWVKLYCEYSFVSQLESPESKGISSEIASKFGVEETWDEKMSGGEKTRFKLAQCFHHNRVLIFADEPTSNIDIAGIELLESRFAAYRGGLVLISHDRSFLDKLCNKILEIENGKVKLYSGNYSDYSLQKAKERDRAQFEYLQYINEKKRLNDISLDLKQKSKSVRKAPKRMGNSEARLHKMGDQKAKASLERAKKSTEARIEHLEVKEKPAEQELIKLSISDTNKLYSRIVIEGNKINKAFGEKVIFKDASFRLFNGTKTALLGPNGSGKSTLLKMIIQQDDAIKIAPAAKIGYFSQDMSILEDNLTVLQNVLSSSIYAETTARILLARLLFKREDVYKRVSTLSGGERVKVSFAKILLQDINLLILDEPTNYLDIMSLEVIEEALQKHEGTLLFVTHDRKFISSLADHIMTIENHKIKIFNGTYEEYAAKKHQATDTSADDVKKQIIIMQHRLTEIVSRLSMPAKGEAVEALDQEYYEVLDKLRKLQDRLGKGN